MRPLRKYFMFGMMVIIPALITAIFWLDEVKAQTTVASPKYDALFTAVTLWPYSNDYVTTGLTKFSIENGKVVAYFRFPITPEEAVCCHSFSSENQPKLDHEQLYIFDTSTGHIHEIQTPINPRPTNPDRDWHKTEIPEVRNFKIDTNITAPDGYKFLERSSYHKENGSLEYNGPDWSQFTIEKGSQQISLKIPNISESADHTRFLGWVISGGEKSSPAATSVPQSVGIEDSSPQYDILFTEDNPCCREDQEDNAYEFKIVQGKLVAYHSNLVNADPSKIPYLAQSRGSLLYIYDTKTSHLRKVVMPPVVKSTNVDTDWHEINLPETEGLNVSVDETAPDGYNCRQSSQASGDAWMQHTDEKHLDENPYLNFAVEKEGHVINIKLPPIHGYGSKAHFLGWISRRDTK